MVERIDDNALGVVTGQTLDEWLGYGWLDAIHPDDRAYAERQWREAMAAKCLLNAEFRMRAPDGKWRWTNVRAAPVLNAGGEIEKWAGMNIDIDARKRAEVALSESETKFRAVFETMNEACCIFDLIDDDQGRPVDWRIVEANPGYERQSGLRGVVGRLASEFMPGTEPYWIEMFGRVAESGEGEHIEKWHQPTGRWIHSSTARVGGHGSRRLASVFFDITERKRDEQTLRESEERQAFLLELSDALRPLENAQEIERVAVRLLGRKLGASRVFYATVDEEGETWSIQRDYSDDDEGGAGRFPMSDYQRRRLADWKAGKITSVSDSETDPSFTAGDRESYAAFNARAAIGVPLVKAGRFAALLVVNQRDPREWQPAEIALAKEAAERTWAEIERSRAEAALRESEQRLAAAFESVPAGLAALDLDGRAVVANAEFRRFLPKGTIPSRDPEHLSRWEAWSDDGRLLDPQDWPSARALRGESVAGQEMLYTDDDGRKIWTIVASAPTFNSEGNVTGIVSVISDIHKRKQAEEDLQRSERHSKLLLAELQHRVRNTLAIVRSIAQRTAENSSSVDEMLGHFRGRLDAFSRVQAALTRSVGGTVSLVGLVEDELIAHAAREGQQVSLDGPDILLEPKTAERLSLAIHELTTNAVKHGALTQADGRIQVRWKRKQANGSARLLLNWKESGVEIDEQPARQGFGMELLLRSLPYDLQAETKVELMRQGLEFHLDMPLREPAKVG